jgi:hypothetical protein
MVIAFHCTGLLAQKTSLQNYVPSNAKGVVNLNLPSLATKMSWQQVQQLGFLSDAMKDAPPAMQELIKNPASSGIDFSAGFYIVSTAPQGDDSKAGTILYGALSDAARFRKMIEAADSNGKILSSGLVNTFASKKSVIGWTSDVFALSMPGKKKPRPSDEADEHKIKVPAIPSAVEFEKLLRPAQHPLNSDPRFAKAMNENGDIRFWVNRNYDTAKMSKNKANQMLKMMNWSMAQSGNFMSGVVNFEKGKTVAHMRNYMNPKMDSLYRIYPNKNLNVSVFNKFPAGTPIAVFSFSLSPDFIKAIFKENGMDKMLDSVAAKSKVNLKDVAGAINGDLTFADIKASNLDENDSISRNLGGLQFFLAASVKNKSKLESLIASMKKPKAEGNEDGDAPKKPGPFGPMKPAFLVNDSFFVASISSFAAEKFLSSSNGNEVSSLLTPYAANSSVFALDLKSILGFAMQMSKKKSPGNTEEQAKMVETFDKLVFYGGQYEDGAALATAELQFSDKDENSLSQFVKFIESAAAMGMKNKKSNSYNKDEDTSPGNGEVKEEENEMPPPPPPPAKPKPKAKPKTVPQKKKQ